MLRNKAVAGFVALICLACPVGAGFAAPEVQNTEIEIQNPSGDLIDSSVNEAIQNSTKEVVTPRVEDVTVMTPNANKEIKNEVLNDTNNNLKFTIKKFLCAMFGVALSSVIIFLILTVMNKVHFLKNIPVPRKEEDEPIKDEAAGGENEALKIFFEKTQ